MTTKTKPELAMNWSRTEGELVIRRNGAPIHHARAIAEALNPNFLAALDLVGYDLKTLRFSIRKKKAEVRK